MINVGVNIFVGAITIYVRLYIFVVSIIIEVRRSRHDELWGGYN